MPPSTTPQATPMPPDNPPPANDSTTSPQE
jgi:hypothetical protein